MSYKIPKQLKCKLCSGKFPNPIHQGARVSASICTTCRHSFFSAKTLRALHINKSEEEFIQDKEEKKRKLKKKEVLSRHTYITLSMYSE